jgi:hypothetical protein
MVITKQIGLLRKKVQAELVPIKWRLLGMAVAILLLVGILLMITVTTILGLVTRSTNEINPLGVFISAAYNGIILLLSYNLWTSYRLAGKILLITEQDKREAMSTKTNVPEVQ